MSSTLPDERKSIAIRDFRPGTFALRDAWFPLVHSSWVKRRPLRRAVHGQPVFYWRDDSGMLHATEDHPAQIERGHRRHRAFTGDTSTYPLVERYGYAWIWYGDPAAASVDLLPSIPHIPVDGAPRSRQLSVVFDCSYELNVENLLDLTHADFLHSELTGDPLSDDDKITVESTSETVTMTRTALHRRVPTLQRPLARGARHQDVRFVTHVHVRSGLCVIHADFDPGPSVRLSQPVNPESRSRTRSPASFDFAHCPQAFGLLWAVTGHRVGWQDNWALRAQNPHYIGAERQRDLSCRFDLAGLRYRKVYQALVARQERGDFTYLSDGDPARDVRSLLGLDRRT
jgi:Vanillate O-demethylase oxygenase C-terminal domain